MQTEKELAEERLRTQIPSQRYAPKDALANLGPLGELAGTWDGTGFNLIARPDFHDKTDLYLQLNQTREHLKFEPIGGPIPNRGFGQDDIQLFGMTYLQEIVDKGLDGGLHIEPGIWVIQPPTTFPNEQDPADGHIVGRMASIPHGNAVLAQGIVTPFNGVPVKTVGGVQYNGSLFPSFNTTPFGVPPTAPEIVFNAAGTSEKIAGPKAAAPPPIPFPMYDLDVPDGPIAPNHNFGGVIYNPQPPLPPPNTPSFTLNTRTPYHTLPTEPALPHHIDGVTMQHVINDPILLLQKVNEDLEKSGHTFEGFSFNISSVRSLNFLKNKDSAPPPAGVVIPPVTIPQFGGGVENIPFLIGTTVHETPPKPNELRENAKTAVVYATFWVSKVTHKNPDYSFMQLQYAQMVVLNFPIFSLLNSPGATYVNLGWPHVSVATLRKSFG